MESGHQVWWEDQQKCIRIRPVDGRAPYATVVPLPPASVAWYCLHCHNRSNAEHGVRPDNSNP